MPSPTEKFCGVFTNKCRCCCSPGKLPHVNLVLFLVVVFSMAFRVREQMNSETAATGLGQRFDAAVVGEVAVPTAAFTTTTVMI